MKYDFISKRKIFYVISGISIGLSILALALWGLKFGIDFSGGTLWEFRFNDVNIEKANIEETLRAKISGELMVQKSSDGVFSVRTKEINEAEHQNLASSLKSLAPDFEELRFETIGPTVGKTLQTKSIQAIVFAVLGISIYITYAFRKASLPVASWKYGLATIFTLFHDVIIPLGVFAWLGKFKQIEIDTNFVTAMLVIMGFSVHDTIVVFDRIREKIRTSNTKNFIELVNLGLNETVVRSFNTSLTAILALVAVYFWGSYTLQYFILAMIIGIGVGTYSSIAIASPMIIEFWLHQQKKK
ncbi:MAG: protein-export membrane protein SecF, preprotein translocase subunit SecF [Parcubacteria group bacterium GW2011_GWC1_45_9]|nr:MAG: Protein translocase subunit SecF [Parcubacteria group bacterium GW2011_GWB1_45_10]KKU16262.1 MAG: protein-export membrane protein SecF, preprotein translocase subunit SecF [Parcubacteria group bacterium GW2011_GWC1_45_9]